MADWTNVADATLEPGKPIRAIDARALRENPIAIAEGAAGAPRIAGQSGPAVQTAGLFDGAVTNAKLQPPIAGTNNIIASIGDFSVGSNFTNYILTNVVAGQFGVRFVALVAGTVTIQARHRQIDTGTSFMRFTKNNAVLQEYSTTSSTFQTRTLNVSVAVGDLLVVQHRSGTAFGSSEYGNVRIFSNNPNFAVA
jgi:hypothetical protein